MKKTLFLVVIFLSSAILAQTLGTLVVKTNPEGAKVYVDNKYVGITPYQDYSITIGKHSLELILSKDFPTESREIFVNKTDPVIVEFDFFPDVSKLNFDVNIDKKLVSSYIGNAQLLSNPLGAQVIFNSKPVGITPLPVKDSPVGNYAVEFSLNGQTIKGHFSIIKDETVRILADFKQKKIIDLSQLKQPQDIVNITAKDSLSLMLAKAQEQKILAQKIAQQKAQQQQQIIIKMQTQFQQVEAIEPDNAQKSQFWLAYLNNPTYRSIWQAKQQIQLQQQALLALASIAPQNMQNEALVQQGLELARLEKLKHQAKIKAERQRQLEIEEKQEKLKREWEIRIKVNSQEQAKLSAQTVNLLKSKQAFKLSTLFINNKIILHWNIAPGYYLYKDKFRLSSIKDLDLGKMRLPESTIKNDALFGAVNIYRDQVSITTQIHSLKNNALFNVHYQGCADIGVCYPPTSKIIRVDATDFERK